MCIPLMSEGKCRSGANVHRAFHEIDVSAGVTLSRAVAMLRVPPGADM
jgi:hypothetical protein